MKCTRVEIVMPIKATSNRRLLCWANITLDHVLLIKGVRLYEINNGGQMERWIKLPERPMPYTLTGGEFHNIPIVLALKKELFNHITEEVFKAFDNDPRRKKN